MDYAKFAPEKFTGNFREDAEKWLLKVNLFTKAAKLKDEEVCDFIPLLLEDHALMWYKNLPEEITHNRTKLAKVFLTKYGDTCGDRILAFHKFAKREQQPREAMGDFINDIQEWGRKCRAPDDVVLEKLWLHSLQEHTWGVLAANPFPETSLDMERQLRASEATKRLQYEKSKDDTSANSGDTVKPRLQNVTSNSEKADSKSEHFIYKTNNSITSVPKDKAMPRNYRTPCFRCGKCDHFPSQCHCIRNAKKNKKCKKIGHIAKMCRTKFRNDDKNVVVDINFRLK